MIACTYCVYRTYQSESWYQSYTTKLIYVCTHRHKYYTFLCVCVCTYLHICTYTRTSVCIPSHKLHSQPEVLFPLHWTPMCTYKLMYIHTQISYKFTVLIYIYIYIYIHILHIHTYIIYTCVYIHACIHTYIHTYIYIYIYIYTHTHTPKFSVGAKHTNSGPCTMSRMFHTLRCCTLASAI